jgi:hypothetical protein
VYVKVGRKWGRRRKIIVKRLATDSFGGSEGKKFKKCLCEIVN